MKLNKRFKRRSPNCKKFSSGELKRRHGFVQSQLLNLGHNVFSEPTGKTREVAIGVRIVCKVHSCSVFEWERTHVNRLRYIRFFLIFSIYFKRTIPSDID